LLEDIQKAVAKNEKIMNISRDINKSISNEEIVINNEYE